MLNLLTNKLKTAAGNFIRPPKTSREPACLRRNQRKDGSATYSGRWAFSEGSGELHGIHGNGTYHGLGAADGSGTIEVAGEYRLPPAKSAAKRRPLTHRFVPGMVPGDMAGRVKPLGRLVQICLLQVFDGLQFEIGIAQLQGPFESHLGGIFLL